MASSYSVFQFLQFLSPTVDTYDCKLFGAVTCPTLYTMHTDVALHYNYCYNNASVKTAV